MNNLTTFLSSAPVLATVTVSIFSVVLILINYWFPDLLSLGSL
ncbi:MAG: Photosystem I reaction center subunit IX [Cyanobacteria bacterium QH_8_48_120]|jgi:hypothetical protein|nr:MAG: Photosystem I reaction center subunit IX [Cyanobacteria bacterium QH_1_48_107]PSO59848.1 MAG: Photosystem I reaction center subunit IX [Cyanobacteria bacterium QH_10_48_56]PSO62897.1 MAG: Photosystem I reaction center subunit IX [Cyanobacteria bacterium QH_2_48_84]PSO64366.1 MAG: Photosystem I reaction center subunit IX [Cyanobacteria bacterium QH_7_48_89]PSO65035.1 MAG: Photosystem I reaction center subunit IX [Cyanobacteria bacterium QH_6_48_35]PSO67383.1 MAG: Photosystem I reaction 